MPELQNCGWSEKSIVPYSTHKLMEKWFGSKDVLYCTGTGTVLYCTDCTGRQIDLAMAMLKIAAEGVTGWLLQCPTNGRCRTTDFQPHFEFI
jgi:hypothetical protein